MDLRLYSDEVEKDLRTTLETMADYAVSLSFQSKKESSSETASQIGARSALEIIKEMNVMCEGLYIKNPDTTFYSSFLKEAHPLITKLRKEKSLRADRQLKKLDLIKTSIRRGKRMAYEFSLKEEDVPAM